MYFARSKFNYASYQHNSKHSRFSSTAILVFSRSVQEEAKVKTYNRWAGKKSGRAVASMLIRHTLAQARCSGLAVVPFFSNRQTGASFGERLCNAMEHAFSLGYSNVIVSGTDSPSISSAQFVHIAGKLACNSVVAAPAQDGGIYLLGIRSEAYERALFLKLPWLTATLFTWLQRNLQVRGFAFATAAMGVDMDCVSDLHAHVRQFPRLWFAAFVTSLSGRWRKCVMGFYNFFPATFFLCSPALRGPPFLLP